MEIVSRAAACAVIGSILALLLRKHTPELSLTTTLITGMVIVWISSSVVRDQLYFQRQTILSMLGDELSRDPLFDSSKDEVKNIVLR